MDKLSKARSASGPARNNNNGQKNNGNNAARGPKRFYKPTDHPSPCAPSVYVGDPPAPSYLPPNGSPDFLPPPFSSPSISALPDANYTSHDIARGIDPFMTPQVAWANLTALKLSTCNSDLEDYIGSFRHGVAQLDVSRGVCRSLALTEEQKGLMFSAGVDGSLARLYGWFFARRFAGLAPGLDEVEEFWRVSVADRRGRVNFQVPNGGKE